MEGLDACDECMAHSGSRSAPTPLCAGVLAGAGNTALTSALRYSAGPRAAQSIEFPRRTAGMGRRRVGQRAIELCRLDATAKRARPAGHSRRSSPEPTWQNARSLCSLRAPPAVSRPPTDGRPRKRFVRCSAAQRLRSCRFLHDLFLALIAMHEARSMLETSDSLTCKDSGVQGSNVRHEAQPKAREAGFGLSPRWRG
jgi:hypothetical protein